MSLLFLLLIIVLRVCLNLYFLIISLPAKARRQVCTNFKHTLILRDGSVTSRFHLTIKIAREKSI